MRDRQLSPYLSKQELMEPIGSISWHEATPLSVFSHHIFVRCKIQSRSGFPYKTTTPDLENSCPHTLYPSITYVSEHRKSNQVMKASSSPHLRSTFFWQSIFRWHLSWSWTNCIPYKSIFISKREFIKIFVHCSRMRCDICNILFCNSTNKKLQTYPYLTFGCVSETSTQHQKKNLRYLRKKEKCGFENNITSQTVKCILSSLLLSILSCPSCSKTYLFPSEENLF